MHILWRQRKDCAPLSSPAYSVTVSSSLFAHSQVTGLITHSGQYKLIVSSKFKWPGQPPHCARQVNSHEQTRAANALGKRIHLLLHLHLERFAPEAFSGEFPCSSVLPLVGQLRLPWQNCKQIYKFHIILGRLSNWFISIHNYLKKKKPLWRKGNRTTPRNSLPIFETEPL